MCFRVHAIAVCPVVLSFEKSRKEDRIEFHCSFIILSDGFGSDMNKSLSIVSWSTPESIPASEDLVPSSKTDRFLWIR